MLLVEIQVIAVGNMEEQVHSVGCWQGYSAASATAPSVAYRDPEVYSLLEITCEHMCSLWGPRMHRNTFWDPGSH